MPGVRRLVADKRKEMGDAHVAECQRRGLAGEPGWFFAREGTLAVGTPWPEIADIAGWQISSTQVLVCLRPLALAGADGERAEVAGGAQR